MATHREVVSVHWEDLPEGPLTEIANRVTRYEDFETLKKKICHNWTSVLKSSTFHGGKSLQVPLLMMADKDKDDDNEERRRTKQHRISLRYDAQSIGRGFPHPLPIVVSTRLAGDVESLPRRTRQAELIASSRNNWVSDFLCYDAQSTTKLLRCRRRLRSLTNKSFTGEFLELRGAKACFSCSLGWLLVVSSSDSMSLLNPITHSRVQLPLLQIQSRPQVRVLGIMKFALSASPSEAPESYTMFMISLGVGSLRVWRPGYPGWIRVLSNHITFRDIIFYGGKLYALHFATDAICKVFCYDEDSWDNICKTDQQIHPPSRCVGEARVTGVSKPFLCRQGYLVHSGCEGKLWVVLVELDDDDHDSTSTLRQRRSRRRGVRDYGEDLSGRYGVQQIHDIRRFRVFEIDVNSGDGMGVEVTSLGRRSLFLGHNESLSIEVGAEWWCKPNCIYFTSDYHGYTGLQGSNNLGVYHMVDGSFEVYKCGSCPSTPPLWVEPRC